MNYLLIGMRMNGGSNESFGQIDGAVNHEGLLGLLSQTADYILRTEYRLRF